MVVGGFLFQFKTKILKTLTIPDHDEDVFHAVACSARLCTSYSESFWKFYHNCLVFQKSQQAYYRSTVRCKELLLKMPQMVRIPVGVWKAAFKVCCSREVGVSSRNGPNPELP